jgi:hypothetical protein
VQPMECHDQLRHVHFLHRSHFFKPAGNQAHAQSTPPGDPQASL